MQENTIDNNVVIVNEEVKTDSKFEVFVLGCTTDNNPDGFLLFLNEEKSDFFLEICKIKLKTMFKETISSYHKIGFKPVSKFIYEKVKSNGNFFVRNLDY